MVVSSEWIQSLCSQLYILGDCKKTCKKTWTCIAWVRHVIASKIATSRSACPGARSCSPDWIACTTDFLVGRRVRQPTGSPLYKSRVAKHALRRLRDVPPTTLSVRKQNRSYYSHAVDDSLKTIPPSGDGSYIPRTRKSVVRVRFPHTGGLPDCDFFIC
jgi:hypothetical protein